MAKARIQFGEAFLQCLSDDKDSCVSLTKCSLHLALLPMHLVNVKKSIEAILNKDIAKYHKELGGIVLGYKNIILLEKSGAINYDSYHVHIDIEADFFLFKPERDKVLNGYVSKISTDHVGCLVYNAFNVACPKTDEAGGDWLGSRVTIGQEVSMKIEETKFDSNLPYIRGSIQNVVQLEDSGISASDDIGEEYGQEVNDSSTCETRRMNKVARKRRRTESSENNSDMVISPAKKSKRISPDNEGVKKKKHKKNGKTRKSTTEKPKQFTDEELSEQFMKHLKKMALDVDDPELLAQVKELIGEKPSSKTTKKSKRRDTERTDVMSSSLINTNSKDNTMPEKSVSKIDKKTKQSKKSSSSKISDNTDISQNSSVNTATDKNVPMNVVDKGDNRRLCDSIENDKSAKKKKTSRNISDTVIPQQMIGKAQVDFTEQGENERGVVHGKINKKSSKNRKSKSEPPDFADKISPQELSTINDSFEKILTDFSVQARDLHNTSLDQKNKKSSKNDGTEEKTKNKNTARNIPNTIVPEQISSNWEKVQIDFSGHGEYEHDIVHSREIKKSSKKKKSKIETPNFADNIIPLELSSIHCSFERVPADFSEYADDSQDKKNKMSSKKRKNKIEPTDFADNISPQEHLNSQNNRKSSKRRDNKIDTADFTDNASPQMILAAKCKKEPADFSDQRGDEIEGVTLNGLTKKKSSKKKRTSTQTDDTLTNKSDKMPWDLSDQHFENNVKLNKKSSEAENAEKHMKTDRYHLKKANNEFPDQNEVINETSILEPTAQIEDTPKKYSRNRISKISIRDFADQEEETDSQHTIKSSKEKNVSATPDDLDDRQELEAFKKLLKMEMQSCTVKSNLEQDFADYSDIEAEEMNVSRKKASYKNRKSKATNNEANREHLLKPFPSGISFADQENTLQADRRMFKMEPGTAAHQHVKRKRSKSYSEKPQYSDHEYDHTLIMKIKKEKDVELSTKDSPIHHDVIGSTRKRKVRSLSTSEYADDKCHTNESKRIKHVSSTVSENSRGNTMVNKHNISNP